MDAARVAVVATTREVADAARREALREATDNMSTKGAYQRRIEMTGNERSSGVNSSQMTRNIAKNANSQKAPQAARSLTVLAKNCLFLAQAKRIGDDDQMMLIPTNCILRYFDSIPSSPSPGFCALNPLQRWDAAVLCDT